MPVVWLHPGWPVFHNFSGVNCCYLRPCCNVDVAFANVADVDFRNRSFAGYNGVVVMASITPDCTVVGNISRMSDIVRAAPVAIDIGMSAWQAAGIVTESVA